MNEDILYGKIWEEYLEAKTMRALAKKWGVTPGYINDILKHRRTPGPKILRHFGLKRKMVFVYEELKKKEGGRG